MKKLINYILILFLTASSGLCIADESYDDWGSENFAKSWDGQKVVTDKEFEEVMSKLESKKKKKEQKSKMKGSSLKKGDEGIISDLSEMSHLICFPVTLLIDDIEVPPGHYQLKAERTRSGINFKLYQAYSLIATIRGIETQDDFDQPEIHFAKVLPRSENQIMLIYGSLDYNAYAFINIKQMDY